MEAAKELPGDLLLLLYGEVPQILDFANMVLLLEKGKYLSSLSVQNEVTSFKFLKRFGVKDSIMKLRGLVLGLLFRKVNFQIRGQMWIKFYL